MNKNMMLLCVLSLSSTLLSMQHIKEAIEKSQSEKLMGLSEAGLTITPQDKVMFQHINKQELSALNASLAKTRFDRADKLRLALATGSLATAALLGYFFYACWQQLTSNKGDDDEAFLGMIGSSLGMPFAAGLGLRELYKAVTQYDRKQQRNRAQAISALLANIKTSEQKRNISIDYQDVAEPALQIGETQW